MINCCELIFTDNASFYVSLAKIVSELHFYTEFLGVTFVYDVKDMPITSVVYVAA